MLLNKNVFTLFFFTIVGCFSLKGANADADSARLLSSPYLVVSSITLKGNQITKPRIILRELTFANGDTILRNDFFNQIRHSRENLINTSLFNFVTVDTLFTGENKVDITFTFLERWYIFPIPIVEIAERNFNTWLQNFNLNRANYGFYIQWDNFMGRKESITLKVRAGYAEQYGLAYDIPYLDKKQTTGAGFSFSFNRGHEIAYKTLSDQPQFFKDPDNPIRKEFASRIYLSNRQGLYMKHLLYLDYYSGKVADTITHLTHDYYKNNQSSMQYFTLGYNYKLDHRDYKPYPLKGYYIELNAAKQGLGILPNEKLNAAFAGIFLRKYLWLGGRFYLGASAEGNATIGPNLPYFVQRALGYSDEVRGYEYYVIDGQSYALFKSTLHYQLVRTRIQKIPYLKWEKFNTFHYAIYLSVFSDAGYVNNLTHLQGNSLPDTWLFGNGVGIDFVTYYDAVFRLEYSINRMGEAGFFLNLNAPL